MANNPLKVSAPANVMLMGEHAVLFGCRAIVCAVEQRMHVSLSPRQDKRVSIDSALASYSGTLEQISEPHSDTHIVKLAFVFAAIRTINPERGFDLTIHSAFSHTVGLGSSAAVTAATVAVLMQYKYGNFSAEAVFDNGLKVIHSVQQRGSGSDLAASVFGGMVGYTATPRQIDSLIKPTVNEQNNSKALPVLDLFYCGYKTPTPAVLAMVEHASKAFPEIYQAIYRQMHQVTLAAEKAIKHSDWEKLGQLMNIYHGLMDALGVSDAQLSALVYQARNKRNVLGAKISGSGLGDCIITLASAPISLTAKDKLRLAAPISADGIVCSFGR